MLLPAVGAGQYFGRNKPVYHHVDFRLQRSPHIDLYHNFSGPVGDSVARSLGEQASAWYGHHLRLFGMPIPGHNPVMIYQNAGDFQQTNAVQSPIGVGTGGVTEGMKNRVILPVTHSWQRTNHVLGHELVHAFQFNLMRRGDSLSLASLQNVPLWMTEGMAEYFSIGPRDAFTAMWMRDAVRQGDFPSFAAMTAGMSRYFPYRFGQAAMAYIGQRFGDDRLVPWYTAVAMHGLELGTEIALKIPFDTLSNQWQRDSERYYRAQLSHAADSIAPGRQLLSRANGSRINISPDISPNGRYFTYYSERSRIGLDLYLAETASGRTIRKLFSTLQRYDIDAVHFIESSGAWSPDSRRYAIIGFKQGRNAIIVLDVERGGVLREVLPQGIRSLSGLTWSPEGESVYVSGMVQGVSNLYHVDLRSGRAEQLTQDPYSELQPHLRADGRKLLFVTDRLARELGQSIGYSLAEMDLLTRTIRYFDFLPGAKNLQPRYAPDTTRIYFLSDADGFRNLYTLDPQRNAVERLTDLPTGISGIGEMSPAYSVARDTSLLLYGLYTRNEYEIYSCHPDSLRGRPARPNDPIPPLPPDSTATPLDIRDPARLCPGGYADSAADMVTRSLRRWRPAADSVGEGEFKPRFGLDYVSNVGVGVSTGNFGAGLNGGVNLTWSDITGGHVLYTGAHINGEVWDFAGSISYMNRKNPLQWSVGLSHSPTHRGYLKRGRGELREVNGKTYHYDTVRMFHLRDYASMVMGLMVYPFSQTLRAELGLSWAWHSFRLRVHEHLYRNDRYVHYKKYWDKAPASYGQTRVYGAMVYDNTLSGFASPWHGWRARLQLERVWGGTGYVGTLVDVRRYWFRWPVGLALRGYFNARWGVHEQTDYLFPIYLGNPWLLRGYGVAPLFRHYAPGNHVLNVNQLLGSHVSVANAEIRFPLVGPSRLGIIPFPWVPMELALFADAGLVWYRFDDVRLKWQPTSEQERSPLVSVGLSLRINVLNVLVIEPYYAMPLQMGGVKSSYVGLNFLPGW
ncbi:MAG: tolB protein precursor [Bacteroidia bacterium]|nr:MAG: tolB protein precursor [Bacteroidia bacterium]